MYVVVFKRESTNNPLTGRARYRVIGCYEDPLNISKPVSSIRNLGASIKLDKPRRIGTMLNPTWALCGRKS